MNYSLSGARLRSVNRVVVDSSVVLAVIHQEPGSEKITPEFLTRAIIGTVNLAEVQSKLVSSGWPPDEAWADATGSVRDVIPFSAEHARIVGSMIAQTRALGLSFGDRACLALGLAMRAPVYTADRSWKGLRLGIRIHTIR
jgi:PIN domain nuclease of toxin-antitoxin system